MLERIASSSTSTPTNASSSALTWLGMELTPCSGLSLPLAMKSPLGPARLATPTHPQVDAISFVAHSPSPPRHLIWPTVASFLFTHCTVLPSVSITSGVCSSVYSANYPCSSAFDNGVATEWATLNVGVGASIKLNFAKIVMSAFSFKHRSTTVRVFRCAVPACCVRVCP
jgi:hypothetical protein